MTTQKQKMLKKVAIVAGVVAVTVFSASAFNLSNGVGSIFSPLTSPVQLCQEATQNIGRDISNIEAKGLSLQLSSAEIQDLIVAKKQQWRAVCAEAAAQPFTPVVAFTSQVDAQAICDEAQAGLSDDIAAVYERAESMGWDRALTQAKVLYAKQRVRDLCANVNR